MSFWTDTRGGRLRVRKGSVPRHSTRSTEVVVETLDVVLPEVVAVLDLDEDEIDFTGVVDPVGGTRRDVDCLA